MEANNLNQVPNKVSFAKKIGYSIGGATDTLAYDFVAAFLLFFLTNFTGVSPAWAGAILTIGVIWNMFSDPDSRKSVRQNENEIRQEENMASHRYHTVIRFIPASVH